MVSAGGGFPFVRIHAITSTALTSSFPTATTMSLYNLSFLLNYNCFVHKDSLPSLFDNLSAPAQVIQVSIKVGASVDDGAPRSLALLLFSKWVVKIAWGPREQKRVVRFTVRACFSTTKRFEIHA